MIFVVPLGSVRTSHTFNFMVLFQNKSQKLRFGYNEDTVSLLHPNFCNLDITGDPGLPSEAGWVKSVEKLCGDCTEIWAFSLQMLCSLSSLRTEIIQSPCNFHAEAAQRPFSRRAVLSMPLPRGVHTGIVQCHLRHVYGLRTWDFSNLYNFPLTKL